MGKTILRPSGAPPFRERRVATAQVISVEFTGVRTSPSFPERGWPAGRVIVSDSPGASRHPPYSGRVSPAPGSPSLPVGRGLGGESGGEEESLKIFI